MRRFLIVIERANGNSSAYSPDLPGCAATGATPGEAAVRMREAIDLHIQGLREDQLPIPEPSATAAYVEVGVPGEPSGPEAAPRGVILRRGG
jgi:predicted RNase H-like HicB family nuclease